MKPNNTPASTPLSALIEKFFTVRLRQQRQASPHTIASYRDAFRQFLKFAAKHLKVKPSHMAFEQVNALLVSDFLDHLEEDRKVSVRTRNLRLTAIHSFFNFMAYEMPMHGAQIQQVLAIPEKRHAKKQVGFLKRMEFDALLGAPDRNSWSGRRDHAFILTAVQTGLRVSELTALTVEDVDLSVSPHLRVIGKGRKERYVPLAKPTRSILVLWLRELERKHHQNVVFPNRMGQHMSIHGVRHLLRKHQKTASAKRPSLGDKALSVHLLRHTAAMEMVEAGVDRTTIALWLGHESIQSTQVYIDATLKLKEQALAKLTPHQGRPRRYQTEDSLLEFLDSL